MYLGILLKLGIGLIALLIVVRLLGKKELAQLTPFDFVYTIVLGGILEESIFDDKVKVTHVLFAVFLWALFIYLIEKATKKWNPFRLLLKGKPVSLISNGQLDMKVFNKENLEMEQLRTALRQQGIFSLREVRDLFLEPGGNFTINKFAKYEPVINGSLIDWAEDEEPSVLLIDDGEVKEEVLSFAGKTRKWLLDELAKADYPTPDKIAYGEWSSTEGFYILTY